MAYWLLKTEPAEFSYTDLERKGTEPWNGVRNPTALKNLRAMAAGDLAFIYHTGKEKAILGIAKVASAAYADPAAGDPRFVVVDVLPVRRLERPVTLAEVKADPELTGWELARIARLSVMPASAAQWQRVLALAATGRSPWR